MDPNAAAGFWRVGGAIATLVATIAETEAQGHPKTDIIESLTAARELCAQSPFYAYAQQWPRGYAGDFQIVEQIVAQRNHADPGSFAWHLEQQLLTGPMTQQHINNPARRGSPQDLAGGAVRSYCYAATLNPTGAPTTWRRSR